MLSILTRRVTMLNLIFANTECEKETFLDIFTIKKPFLITITCHKWVNLSYSSEFNYPFVAFGRYKYSICFVL